MIILTPYSPRIYPVVSQREWREPSLSMPRDFLGNPEWWTRFTVSAATQDGKVFWKGTFESRDDADAFLFAAVKHTLRVERALHDLPRPMWSPGFYPDDLIVWQYATINYFTSGTSTTIPSDWNNSINTITAIGGAGSAGSSTFDGKNWTSANGGGGGACSRISNQSYTASATRTRQIGAADQDTFLKADDNSTNAILAKGGTAYSGGGSGGAAGSGVGTTKFSGGNTGSSSGAQGGGGGGAASYTANGNSGSGTGGGNSGSGAGGGSTGGIGGNGTELGSSNGAGAGGGGGDGAGGGNGGNYGGSGGGAGAGAGAAGGTSRGGILAMEYTPAAASSMKNAFNIPNGW